MKNRLCIIVRKFKSFRRRPLTLYLGHYIEHLRQAVMCNADVSTMYWRKDPFTNEFKISTQNMHTCRNFEDLRDWAFERFIDDLERDGPVA